MGPFRPLSFHPGRPNDLRVISRVDLRCEDNYLLLLLWDLFGKIKKDTWLLVNPFILFEFAYRVLELSMESKGTHLRICILLDHYKEGDPSHDLKKNCIMYLRIFVLSLNSSFFIRRKKKSHVLAQSLPDFIPATKNDNNNKSEGCFCLFV